MQFLNYMYMEIARTIINAYRILWKNQPSINLIPQNNQHDTAKE